MNFFRRMSKAEPTTPEAQEAPAHVEAVEAPATPAPVVVTQADPAVRPKPLAIDLSPGYSLNGLLQRMVEMEASDLHLETGSAPVLRLKGDIRFLDLPVLTSACTERLLGELAISEAQWEKFHQAGNLDFAHEVPGVARFRVNYLKQQRGLGCVIRVIPSKVPSLQDLNLPVVLARLALSSRGIILVTGPTGSGKSTTLAAMIDHVNRTRRGHIITIEEPVEFTHVSNQCLIDHREVGHHTRSFAAALKSALREDPDIVLVGELRDLETISLALTAAEMGVLVFGTLHTNSAAKTIDRIIDVFPSEQQDQVRSQLSQSLRGIVAQQLLKRADGSGRLAALEVLICNEGLRNLIREGKTAQIASFILMGKDEGMQTLDAHLVELLQKGVISLPEALSRAHDLTVFKRAGFQVPG